MTRISKAYCCKNVRDYVYALKATSPPAGVGGYGYSSPRPSKRRNNSRHAQASVAA
jgi:hypothetical protein